jgi:hypothetical protein
MNQFFLKAGILEKKVYMTEYSQKCIQDESLELKQGQKTLLNEPLYKKVARK